MSNNSKVLALKYRPQVFKDLIGQNIIVETIEKSISQNKIPNAFLFRGIRGVGKTTIGRVLSKILRRTFVDIDFEIEKASGQKIHHIFEKYGEDEFRKIEKR